MKVGMIALTAALLMLAVPAWAGPTDPCAGSSDSDGDTVNDSCDNCVDVSNAGAAGCDTDKDGYGNACDSDHNNDQTVNAADFGFFLPDFLASSDMGTGTDNNCDTTVNAADFGTFLPLFLIGKNGDSGLKCAGNAQCGDRAGN
jgi:hypothetical protein